MSGGSRGSVTLWIGDLIDGGDEAAQPLWERYFESLVRLARFQLRRSRSRTAVADEEDAALSAFDSFCQGARKGKYPRLADRDDLWRLLVVITRRKVLDQQRHERAKERGAGQVVGESDLPASADGRGVLEQFPAGQLRFRGALEIDARPSPAFAAELVEEYRQRLEALGDETLRRVAVLKMEGYTDGEVATRLGCTRRNVQRKLALIREEWGGPST
jgi:DNA-directed RNA polymerase specialized sigma24 family protein